MTARRRRRLIVTGSLVAHAGVLVAFVISGLWKIERLDAAPNDTLNLALTTEPSMEGGGPHPKATTDFKPKEQTKPVVTTPHQPMVTTTTDDTKPSDTDTTGDNPDGKGTHGKGPGDDNDKGKCATPPCGSDDKVDAPKPVVQVVVEPAILKPAVIQGLRISGDTEPRPSDYDKNSMWQQHIDSTSAMFKVCISATGDVSSVTRVKSTKYSDYDQRIANAIHGWKYRPYTVGGQPAPACGMVTFVYSIQR
ncbi:MAG TPA: hypothetical protein VGO00_29550 [Kofleriaceae bacterium]|jgi:hypothetical protein|nr:hypothetical protein [Kofleriaceae bacterium]